MNVWRPFNQVVGRLRGKGVVIAGGDKNARGRELCELLLEKMRGVGRNAFTLKEVAADSDSIHLFFARHFERAFQRLA